MDRTFPRHPARPALGFIARFFAASDMARSRRRLASLDPHLLADIGLTRTEAVEEAERAAWDVPAFWRR